MLEPIDRGAREFDCVEPYTIIERSLSFEDLSSICDLRANTPISIVIIEYTNENNRRGDERTVSEHNCNEAKEK